MYIKEKKTFAMTYRNLGLLCPRCYCDQDLGSITVHATIDVAPTAEESNIRFNQTRILNYPFAGETVFGPQPHSFIYAICPDCGCTNMIPVDSNMTPYLRLLNHMGAYTLYSCYGETKGDKVIEYPYIVFAEKIPDAVIRNLMQFDKSMTHVPKDMLTCSNTILGLYGAFIPNDKDNTVVLPSLPYIYDTSCNGIKINIDAIGIKQIYEQYPDMFWMNLTSFFDSDPEAVIWRRSNKEKYKSLIDYYNSKFMKE